MVTTVCASPVGSRLEDGGGRGDPWCALPAGSSIGCSAEIGATAQQGGGLRWLHFTDWKRRPWEGVGKCALGFTLFTGHRTEVGIVWSILQRRWGLEETKFHFQVLLVKLIIWPQMAQT